MSSKDGDGYYDFDDSLELAERWENLLEPQLGSIVWRDAERISYEDDPESQLSGIDHVLVEREFSDDALQLKVNTKKYDSIWYEVRHEVVDSDKEWDGWVYEYKPRVILYVWLSDDGRRVIDGKWLLINDTFRGWFDGIRDKYPEKRTKKPTKRYGRKYYTYGVTIPISNIPAGFIRPAKAAIGLKSDTNQTELSNYEPEGQE